MPAITVTQIMRSSCQYHGDAPQKPHLWTFAGNRCLQAGHSLEYDAFSEPEFRRLIHSHPILNQVVTPSFPAGTRKLSSASTERTGSVFAVMSQCACCSKPLPDESGSWLGWQNTNNCSMISPLSLPTARRMVPGCHRPYFGETRRATSRLAATSAATVT